jgi:rubrerythrin
MSDEVTDPGVILRNAVGMEIEGKRFYEGAAAKMTGSEGRDMFLKLVEHERVHIDILEDQLNMLTQHKGWRPLKQVADGAIARRISVFEDKDIKDFEMRHDAGELEVIELGMEVERKSVEFYKAAGDNIRDRNAKEMFNWLVDQESKHLGMLESEHHKRKKS